ncbi:MAG: SCO family protein [Candidatus Thiodiazotropha sp. (ex Notomyrtea botanica)]|nr:SCO family protein [Candidatus Thiodiazotropha sp. (ex Notomyrtea botanica)]
MARRKTTTLVSLLLFSIWVGACYARAADLGGDFMLTDQRGEDFKLEHLRGKVVLLFFGYTYCPDICPTELSNLASVLNALDEREEEVRGVFISLDPERDTPEVLLNYTRYFNENLLGLTGSQSEIARVARQYQVKFKRHESADGRYTLDHSANLYVIDRTGQLTTVVPYGFPPEHVLNVVKDLLDNGG